MKIIPVPKPGKDTSDSSNYRPIAQTITVCFIYHPPTMVFNSTDLENLIAQLPPPSYCLGTLTPTVPYGVALKLIFEER